MTTYKWANTFNAMASGVSLNGDIEAQDIGDELARIGCKTDLTPKTVVNASKQKRAKLHDLFEWDNAIASTKYRLEQARLAIRSVKVVYENDQGEEKEVRAFTSIRDPKDDKGRRIYVPTEEGMKLRETRDEILMQCLSGLISWRKRWAEYNELSEVIELVDQAAHSIEELVAAE